MKSVRLRLLVLALLPLIVLLPGLLAITIMRWADRYDDLLISKVTSDLRIAEQYLQRIMAARADEIKAIAGSAKFKEANKDGPDAMQRFLLQKRQELGLDFLYIRDKQTDPTLKASKALINKAEQGQHVTALDLYSASELEVIDPSLPQRAKISLVPLPLKEAAKPDQFEDRGMVLHSAIKVDIGQQSTLLHGGLLLNNNLDFISTINNLVYQSEQGENDRTGTATLFLHDIRISTNVKLFKNVLALGTKVSAEVKNAVLGDGKKWLDRAFVVNDWYISGYLPLRNSQDQIIGMLYVGFLEEPFQKIKDTSFLSIFIAFIVVVGISVPLFLWLAQGIFSPLETMIKTMRKIESGDLKARIGGPRTKDEIGEVAGHLDSLLDQVQERDKALRQWADELNDRVTIRTRELHNANKELEATYQRLVMSEKLASLGEIAAGVAHEINNPVAVIQGNLDVLRLTLGEKSADVKTEIALIDEQINRINIIVGKLLKFARPDDYSGLIEQIQISTVIEDCQILVQSSFHEADIEVETQFDPSPDVRINRVELQQVLINLMINANHALLESEGSNRKLDISVQPSMRQECEGVEIIIADNGCGIDPTRIETIFAPFQTSKPGKGTGLGLSISKSLIERAGGFITVSSQLGCGSRFSIWLPKADNLSN
ncbi:MAG: cache domain-containing protein [Cohaesibacter sp.]|nr:cache domain-containing protein [Cohaesibacter sp.]